MPQPTKDPVYRWAYTLLDDDQFDDRRVPRALTLGHTGASLPSVVHAVSRPAGGAGPWWFPQDLAFRGNTVRAILRCARQFSLLPIIPERLLGDDDIELVAAREVLLPACDASPTEPTVKLREATRALVLDADALGEPALSRWYSAVEDFRRACPDERETPVLLALLRFSDHGMIEAPPTRRTHPAIIIGGLGETRAAGDPIETARRDYDNAMMSRRIDLAVIAGFKLGALLEQRNDPEMEGAYRRAVDLGRMIIVDHSMYGTRHDQPASVDSDPNGGSETGHDPRRLDRLEEAPEAALHLGIFLHGRTNDIEGSILAYQFVADSGHPEHAPVAAIRLGGLLFDQGQFDAASGAFVVAMDSGHPELAPRAAALLGDMLQKKGDLPGARQAFERVLEFADDDLTPRAVFSLADLSEQEGDYGAAINGYRRAIDSGHDTAAPAAALHFAILLHRGGELKGADITYRIALQAKHHPIIATKAALGLGSLRMKSADLAGAKLLFELAALSPDEATAEQARRALDNLEEPITDPP